MATEGEKIPYVNLGKSGLKVSQVIYGCMSLGDKRWQEWVVNEDEALPLIKHAYDAGINTFDTANFYSHGVSERIIGAALRKYNIPRKKVVIMTKCYFGVEDIPTDGPWPTSWVPYMYNDGHMVNGVGLSRKNILEAVDASVERLGTYIDVLQIHRYDGTSPEEVMHALNDVVASGKVRYIGASSMRAWEFQTMQNVAEKNGWHKFISMQNYHNLIYREEEREMIPYCKATGVGLIPWSPIARGVLTRPWGDASARVAQDAGVQAMILSGPYVNHDKAIVDRVEEVAKKHGVSMACVATAWSIASGDVPIIGLSSKARIEETVRNAKWKLPLEDRNYLEEMYMSKDPIGLDVPRKLVEQMG